MDPNDVPDPNHLPNINTSFSRSQTTPHKNQNTIRYFIASQSRSISAELTDVQLPTQIQPILQVLNDSDCDVLKKKLLKLLIEADLDHNELIDFEEFTAVISKLMPNQTPAETKKLFKALDTDGTENIALQEFENDQSFDRFLNKLGFVRESSVTSSSPSLISPKRMIPIIGLSNIHTNEKKDSSDANNKIGKHLKFTPYQPLHSSTERLAENELNMSLIARRASSVGIPNFNRNSTESSTTLDDIYAQHSMLGRISMKNRKDKEIMNHEMEIVEKLRIWIEEIGKPAIKQVKELQLKNIDYERELEQTKIHLKTIAEELEGNELEVLMLREDNKNYQQEILSSNKLNVKEKQFRQTICNIQNEEEIKDMEDQMKVLKLCVYKSTEITHEKSDRNMFLEDLNKKLVDENYALTKKNHNLEKQINEQDRKLFSLHTKLLKSSETIAHQKLTINTMENESEIQNEDKNVNTLESNLLEMQASRGENVEDVIHSRKYTVDLLLSDHSLLSAVTSGKEHDYESDEAPFFHRLKTNRSLISDTGFYSDGDVQFNMGESPLMLENENQYKYLMQYTKDLEMQLDEQRLKHEEEKNRLHIESENAFHNEMKDRMRRMIDKERDRIQTLEEEKYNNMEYNLKEKFDREYLLLMNEFELKQRDAERKQKRKWKKHKKQQNMNGEEKIGCNFLPCFSFFPRSAKIVNGEKESNNESDESQSEIENESSEISNGSVCNGNKG